MHCTQEAIHICGYFGNVGPLDEGHYFRLMIEGDTCRDSQSVHPNVYPYLYRSLVTPG